MPHRRRRSLFATLPLAPLEAIASLAASTGLLRPGSSLPSSTGPFAGAPSQPTARLMARERSTLRRSLRASVWEGMAAEVVTATSSGAVLTAWALYLDASPSLIALLGALPFIAQLAQFPAAWMTNRLGPPKVATVAVALSRQALLPLALLSVLDASPETSRRVLLVTGIVSAVLGVVGNNAWTVWMGELVPSGLRGRYFGRRTAMCTLANALGMLGAGLLIDFARSRGHEGDALSLLALVACAAGAVSTILMRRQQPVEHASGEADLRAALRPFAHDGARRLLAYVVPWNVAIGVSGAFFAVHMVKHLHLGFSFVALHAITAATVRMTMAPAWGRLIDRFGARPVLIACSFALPIVPTFWLLPTPERLWPVWLDAVVAGTLWSGHNLASFHLPLTVAPREGRPYFLAAFQGASGLAFALSAAAGGFLVQALPNRFELFGLAWTGTHVVFALSCLGRFGASFLSLRISEPGSSSVRELLGVNEEGAVPAAPVVAARAP